MLRPIEANLSIYNVEQKASQVKDPNAHQFQAMQNEEIAKSAQKQAQTVQTVEKSEGGVKVRDRREDAEEKHKREKGRGKTGTDSGGDSDGQQADPDASRPGGSLDFLA